MRKLARIADWQKEFEADGVTQSSWQTETLVGGKNSTAAKDLQTALRGTGETIGTDSVTGAVIRDNGFTGELGGWVIDTRLDLDKGTTKIYEFVAGNSETGVVGLNETVGDLDTVISGAVSKVNGDIDESMKKSL